MYQYNLVLFEFRLFKYQINNQLVPEVRILSVSVASFVETVKTVETVENIVVVVVVVVETDYPQVVVQS